MYLFYRSLCRDQGRSGDEGVKKYLLPFAAQDQTLAVQTAAKRQAPCRLSHLTHWYMRYTSLLRISIQLAVRSKPRGASSPISHSKLSQVNFKIVSRPKRHMFESSTLMLCDGPLSQSSVSLKVCVVFVVLGRSVYAEDFCLRPVCHLECLFTPCRLIS